MQNEIASDKHDCARSEAKCSTARARRESHGAADFFLFRAFRNERRNFKSQFKSNPKLPSHCVDESATNRAVFLYIGQLDLRARCWWKRERFGGDGNVCVALKVNLSLQIQFGQKSTWLLFAIFLSVKVVYIPRRWMTTRRHHGVLGDVTQHKEC